MAFRLEITQSRKIPYHVEFDETPRFWHPHVSLDAWTDFAFCSNKNLWSNFRKSKREAKKETEIKTSLPRSSHALCPFAFPFDFYAFYLLFIYLFIYLFIIIILDTWFTLLHSVPFLPRNNLFLFSSLYFK